MPHSSPISLAAFDFDGTLTSKDSMFEFIRFTHGGARLLAGLARLSPTLIGFKFARVERQAAKEKLLSYFYKGYSQGRLEEWAAEFCEKRIPAMLRPEALQRLQWHREQGHELYLVTASLSVWTRPWAEQQGMKLLASEAAYEEDLFLGRLAGKNCHGSEKVRRLEEALAGQRIAKRYAYGDSSGDREMLAWADEGIFKPFRG